jgi:hypothetical protein
MTEPQPVPENQLPTTSTPEVGATFTSGVNKTTGVSKSLVVIVLVIVAVFAAGMAGFMYWQNQQLQKQMAIITVNQNKINEVAKPTIAPTITTAFQPTEAVGKPAQTTTYKIPDNWLTFTDEAAGITIKYPPDLGPKLNPNRGAGFNYKAGSYLVDANLGDVIDFYYYGYNGGSRREAFYQGMEDDPQTLIKNTQSASDVSLNGKTFLKLTTTFPGETGSRVFYLIPQGNRLYYFTYAKDVEKNAALFKNLLTVIASSTFNANSQASTTDPNKTMVNCMATSNFLKEKGDTWDARMDASGDMVIIQRLTQALKSKAINKNLIEVIANPQTFNTPSWDILNFALMVDSDQKGNYQDAVVLTIPKAEVDKIIKATPTTISSVSVMMKINESWETAAGEWCRPTSAPGAYFTDKS